ncbi:MAG TPA: 50S ribosomal protein L4 [Nitrospiria bacterium]|nr:50S ribosomal protein L4 [Nitrospiria bacterium]
MPSVEVINLLNERKGTVNLDDRFFGVAARPGLLHEAVVMQLANRRQGTASSKTRGEVRGGGKKPWKQKGTGRARAGSIRSPLWRGGGVIFGPRPRTYAQRFPKQKARVALYGALTAKVQEGSLKVVDDFSLTEPKTRALMDMLKGLHLEGKTLILMDSPSMELERSARNVPFLTVRDLWHLNVYEVIRHKYLLMKRQDLEALQQKFIERLNGRTS